MTPNENQPHDPTGQQPVGSSAYVGGRPSRGTRPTQQSADAAAVEGEALRRRQLRAALCHGTDRSWRDKNRAWPAFVVGVLVALVICAGLGVQGAFQKQQRLDREEKQKREQKQQVRTVTASPGATSTGGKKNGKSLQPTATGTRATKTGDNATRSEDPNG